MNIPQLYSIFNNHNLICTDSRRIIKNSLFFALKGEKFNGNKYALDAIKNGCSYAIIDDKHYSEHPNTILVENVLETLQELAKYHRKKINIPIIGITGTNGKTTSKELISKVLSTERNTYATKGNLNNHIGVPLSVLKIKKNTEIGIIEMGANQAGDIKFLCDISQPNHGVITNIGLAHLKGFSDIEGVTNTKNELYKYLKINNGYVFVNKNNKLLLELAKEIKHSTYGENGKIASTMPFIDINYQNIVVKSKLIGSYQFENIMLAICIGNYFNISLKNIKTAIEEYTPSNNRSQILDTKKNKLILDAYNANPSSMSAMLSSFSKQKYKNKLCILGDMLELGSHSTKEHKKIIKLCRKLSISSYFIGNEFSKVNPDSFRNIDDFTAFLNTNTISNQTILLKGSRGIRLEKLVSSL